MTKGSVLQPWVHELTHMQQTVLLTATRGPDGIRKDHMVKMLLRWYRRCFLYCAIENKVILEDPYDPRGGSFTGPCVYPTKENPNIYKAREDYFRYVDELPHHFQLHFMHAAQILGYKHPVTAKRTWWHEFYLMMVNDLHLFPESEELMDKRLGDNETDWRAREVVTAK